MFNVAIFKLKDMTKYLVGITITIAVVIFATRFFAFKSEKTINDLNKQEDTSKDIGNSSEYSNKINIKDKIAKFFLKSISVQVPVIEELEHSREFEDKEINSKKYAQITLGTELSVIKAWQKNENEKNNGNSLEDDKKLGENQNETDKKEENENTNNIDGENINNKTNGNDSSNTQGAGDLAKTGLETQIVTNNPIKESFNTQYGNVKIKNGTKIVLTDEMMNPNINIDNKNVVIFHTHSCESYTASDLFPYTPTGTYRTTDLNYTVTRVGTELESQLKKYGISVVHDTSYHDYPAYNGSYTRSLATVQNILKTNPSDIIIDLHRDAIGSRSDYAPTVKIGEDYAAQIMYVIGTNQGGLEHPNWQQNLKFAIKVQQKAEELYPGLFKPLMLTEYRYNQHVGKYANIMEVGATGNTMEQCLNSMKYLARVLDEVMK